MEFKEVVLKFKVPDTGYCWDGYQVCQFFDNEGGTPDCELANYATEMDSPSIKYDEKGHVPMPKFCKEGGTK